MTRIQYALALTLGLPALLWLLADTLLPQPIGYFAFRATFIQFSGVLAITMMSVAMLLALRPRWLESRLDGLDKIYRLHKWLGIGSLIVAVLHWWWAQGSKWMVGWGWLDRPARGPRPDPATQGLLEAWFGSQRGLAESVGEWAFYAVVLFIVLALVKRFSYRLFARTHKWIALAYLALVFHSVVLAKFVAADLSPAGENPFKDDYCHSTFTLGLMRTTTTGH
jgi:predicted ferric reductase